MVKEEALGIINTPVEEFKVGDKAYYAEKTGKVVEGKVVAKRISRIGLSPCYSLESGELDRVIQTPHIYKTRRDAWRRWRASKIASKKL